MLFNVAEDVVDETISDAAWDEALRRGCLDGVYTSLGDYPDEDLAAIVETNVLGVMRCCKEVRGRCAVRCVALCVRCLRACCV